MRPTSETEAFATIQDDSKGLLDREHAIHYLAKHMSPAAVEQLIPVLDSDEFSLRWAAADALRYAGNMALIPLLRKLVQSGSSFTVREVTHHALSKNISPTVREQAQEVLVAMKGPAADLATTQAAYQLLRKLNPVEE